MDIKVPPVLYGRQFESNFKIQCQYHQCQATRMPDGCKTVGAAKLIRVKTPFDWIVSWNKHTALIDTKTSKNNHFAHSLIEKHQVDELFLHEKQGIMSGYVVEFREADTVIFIPASALCMRKLKGTGSVRLGDPDVLILGSSNNFDVRRIFQTKVSDRKASGLSCLAT